MPAASYGEAFSAYAAANAMVRAAATRAGERYDRRAQEQFVDRLIQVSSAAPAQAAPQAPARDPAPIFVCGMFRSGSTLAEQLLAQHPGVAAGGELDLLPALVAAAARAVSRVARLEDRRRSRAPGRRYREAVAALFPGATHVTDKRPDNFLYIGLIKSLFPDAKIVHTTRDPLDNCLAIYFLHLDLGLSYATDLMDIGHYYRQYRRLMAHWRTLYGADIIELNYDHFVREPGERGAAGVRGAGMALGSRCTSSSGARTVRSRPPACGRCASRSTKAHPAARATTSSNWLRLRQFLAGLPPL